MKIGQYLTKLCVDNVGLLFWPIVVNSCTHRRRDATRLDSFVSSASAVCIGHYVLDLLTYIPNVDGAKHVEGRP